jgi:hypothetical protein
MERRRKPHGGSQCVSGNMERFRRHELAFNADSVLTEAGLAELKHQAPTGCVLCAIESWDEEAWD